MRFVGRMVLLVLLPVLALVGLASYLAVHFSGTSERAYERVTHTYLVIQTATGILADIDAAESGVRGFVITQNQDYLGSFDDALQRVPRRLAELGELVADNPSQAETVALLQPVVAEKLEILRSVRDRVLAGERSSLLEGASAGVGPGKRAMDSIRTAVDGFVDAERQLLSARQVESQRADRLMLYAALGGSFIGLAALLVGILLLTANNWRLQRTEGRLKRQSEILQLALDNIRHGIAYFDGRGRLAAFNGRFFFKLQFPSELSKLGAPLSAFRDVERARGTSVLEPSVSGSSGVPLNVRLDGSEFEVYRTPTADGGFVISSVDVTQRARAEAMFRQTQKMESIGQLTGGVAHDFNNLLQIVSSNIDLALAAGPDDPRNPERLKAALAGAERGARLTRQLLAFARRQPLEPRPTNLGRLVGDMAEMIRRSLGEAIEVETVTAGGLWSAMADPGQMENAILNLAINARDAMPDGGKLTIEVANASLDETYAADHSEVVPGQYVMLAGSDTGTGMTAETVARAFEPFFSTKPDGQGTGLGLSQVYGYAKQLGGHVKIYSEPGHGTTVKLYLPRTRQPEELLEVHALSAIEFGRETVLVVEDDAAVRAGAVDMLGDLGYRALQAGDAEAALAILMSGTPVDVLFTDVVMPGPLKTRDLVRQAQARQPGIAVLYTSGYTENAIIHNGRLDSDVLLISKPYRREELARKLRGAIAQAQTRTPQAPTDAPPPPNVSPTGTSPVTVLFVEDDALVRLSAVDYLQHLGYAVIEAGNAEQALEAIRSRPEIAVLLTDLGLPGMGGAELIDAARRLRPSLAVAVLTGRSRKTLDDEDALPAGVPCIEKPYELEALRRTIETLVGQPR